MPDKKKQQALANAATAIRKAQVLVMQACRNCNDAAKIHKITIEYDNLDSTLSQILQTLAITDDTAFEAATSSLKKSAGILENDEKQLKSIIDNVTTAANIIGFLTQAVTFIAKL